MVTQTMMWGVFTHDRGTRNCDARNDQEFGFRLKSSAPAPAKGTPECEERKAARLREVEARKAVNV